MFNKKQKLYFIHYRYNSEIIELTEDDYVTTKLTCCFSPEER